MEEFDAKLRYLEGERNVLADSFLQLPQMEKPSEGKSKPSDKGKLIAFDKLVVESMEDDEMLYSFMADVVALPNSWQALLSISMPLHRLIMERGCCRSSTRGCG